MTIRHMRRSMMGITLTPGQVIYRIPWVKGIRQTEGIKGRFVPLRVFFFFFSDLSAESRAKFV